MSAGLALLLWVGVLAVPMGTPPPLLAQAPAVPSAPAVTGTIKGTVVSRPHNEPLSGVGVMITAIRAGATADDKGQFTFAKVPPGTYEIRASVVGYLPTTVSVTVVGGETATVRLQLEVEPVRLSGVEVIGTIQESISKIPGSGTVLGNEEFAKSAPLGVEVLRKVSGVNVRDEEGFGLRPNIGVRGLIPTRSGKVLMLEDGVFIVQSPYGDSQTYYTPQVGRMQRIEVLKGSGQVMYGPQTIGGVVNYITPQPLPMPTGYLRLMGGTNEFGRADGQYSRTWGNLGGAFAYTHLRANQLSRKNTSTRIHDAAAKLVWDLSATSKLTTKVQFFKEQTQATYAALTQIEFEEDPFQNQFKHDTLFTHRWAVHSTYEKRLNAKTALAANLYAYTFHRDWWRQGSNGGANANAPANEPGARTLPDPNRRDGKNRKFWVMGFEPRLRVSERLFNMAHELDYGARVHYELQDRRQIVSASPVSRAQVGLVEDENRTTLAFSGFLHDRIDLTDRWSLSAGVRVENVNYHRDEQLSGNQGSESMTDLIPGLGVTYNPNPRLTLFTGFHRGYGPPQVQDAISTTGEKTELGAEKSWNYEMGMRWRMTAFDAQATGFYMDFQNQIIPRSGAGGSGALYTTARGSAHAGFELSGTLRMDDILPSRTGLSFAGAYTYLPTAEFTDQQSSSFDATVSVKGNRLTYAPEHLLTASARWAPVAWADGMVEAVYIGDQFSDDLNTVVGTHHGRQGLLPANTTWNAEAHVTAWKSFVVDVSVRNFTNTVAIQDRSRGILVAPPRIVQIGVHSKF